MAYDAMSRFPEGTHLPRTAGADTWRPLLELHGRSTEEIMDLPFDLRNAQFHPAGALRIGENELAEWRADLNSWAYDHHFPAALNSERRSSWDVELGKRLLADVDGLPEAQHPDVWCWIATNLIPHFIVHRWGWPALKDGATPTGRVAWSRFGGDLKNGLRIAMHRILTYGPDNTSQAIEQEFQSIQYRPAFGLDRRVAGVVMDTLLRCWEDPGSYYGKHGGSRALDNDDVCIELRLINSLRPLCFASDDEIQTIVLDAVKRLPEYRKPPKGERTGSVE